MGKRSTGPSPLAIFDAGDIRRRANTAVKNRDRTIKEAHENHAHCIRRIREKTDEGVELRKWFAATRRSIYRRVQREYPDMSAHGRCALRQLMVRHINVSALVRECTEAQLYINLNPDMLAEIYDHNGPRVDTPTPVDESDAQIIINAFRMARELCKGVLTITVHKSGDFCTIRIR